MAILDEIKVELKNMKLSKVRIEKCETRRNLRDIVGLASGKNEFGKQ